MKIKIHRGQNQIGGSIIEISTKNTHLIFDAGMNLDEDSPSVPNINGLFNGNVKFDGIFITHYHSDHIGLAYEALEDIPVYMGKKCYEVYKFTNSYVNKPYLKNPLTFKTNETISIGDITVTPFLCDHSAFDSYMFYIQAEGKSILYTGDYRSNGRKSFDNLLKKLPCCDALITEGTTLSRKEKKHSYTEKELEDIGTELMKNHNPVFVLQSSSNIDRIVTMYKSAKRNTKLFLMDLYMAGIAAALGGSIPNPTSFLDVRVFITNNSSKRYKQLLQYGNKRIGRDEIANKEFVMCVRPSMKKYLDKLSQNISFSNALLIYSMWSGYKEKEDIHNFIEYMTSKGVTIHTLHTTGHADGDTIDKLISEVKPKIIIPVHTENAQWFNKYKDNIFINNDENFTI